MSEIGDYKVSLRRFLLTALMALILVSSLTLTLYMSGLLSTNDHDVDHNVPFIGNAFLQKFSSREELKNFLLKSGLYGGYTGLPRIFLEKSFAVAQFVGAAAEPASMDVGYSKTNIQVEGVDEADMVKTDGRYIYLVSGKSVFIIKAYPPEGAKLSSQIQVNATVCGIFVNANRLVIFAYSDIYYPMIFLNDSESKELMGPWTHLMVYDVEEHETPVLIRNVTLNGIYFNSRMIGKHVYVLATLPAYHLGNGEPVLPKIVDNERIVNIEPTSIYYSNVSDFYYAFTVVAAINIQDVEEPITKETFLFGSASCIYVSLNNIYVTVSKYSEEYGETSEIHRIRIDGGKVSYEASGIVPGFVLNQFSMDEHNGYFRIATTTSGATILRGLSATSTSIAREEENLRRNNVYVLNRSLAVVGGIERLAPGEQIYAARFMGERCYLVTFKKVDPLFVISLKDPTKPEVLGQLKIPGYSDYLHPFDEDHLIGIGKWTVEAEEGDFAWYQGVKISIFDVSDIEHPKEVDGYVIGDRGTDSPVLWDHKALLFDKDLNLLAMPVLVAEIDESK
ncbi:MAG: beta-propeller domain-containing protein, partial [Candidatus Bathyarchaeia archaeon]